MTLNQTLFTAETGYDLYCVEVELAIHTPRLTSYRDDAMLVIPRGTRVGVNHECLLFNGRQYYFDISALNIATKEDYDGDEA